MKKHKNDKVEKLLSSLKKTTEIEVKLYNGNATIEDIDYLESFLEKEHPSPRIQYLVGLSYFLGVGRDYNPARGKELFDSVFQRGNEYALTGVLFCGDCGSSYHGCAKIAGRSHKRYEQYICSSKDNKNSNKCKSKPINKDSIELVVAGVLTKVLSQSLASGQMYKTFQKKIEESIRMSIDNYQRSKTAVLRRQAMIVDKIIKTADEKLQQRLESEYQTTITRINEIEKLIIERQAELKKIQNRASYFKKKISQITPEELVKNRPVFKLLVRRLIRRITIGDDITIELL